MPRSIAVSSMSSSLFFVKLSFVEYISVSENI
jgi:hypothetical protein